jgi:hypothetical protein
MYLAGDAVALPSGLGVTVGGRAMIVGQSRVRDRSSLVISLQGVTCREAAAALCGLDISVDAGDARAVDGFLPLDLFRGLRIEWSGGSGSITGWEMYPGNPMLEVEHGGGSFDLPLALLMNRGEIDWENGRARVDLPSGLA